MSVEGKILRDEAGAALVLDRMIPCLCEGNVCPERTPHLRSRENEYAYVCYLRCFQMVLLYNCLWSPLIGMLMSDVLEFIAPHGNTYRVQILPNETTTEPSTAQSNEDSINEESVRSKDE